MSGAYYNENNPHAAAWLRNLIAAGVIADGDVDDGDIRDVAPYELARYTQCHFFAGLGGWSYAMRLAGWADNRRAWSASCPCQPFSAAGAGGGFADERHLWPHAHYLIEELRPGLVFGEQVASNDGLAWLDLVQADMEGTGYAFAAVNLCAAGIGAPHIRQRAYWVADSDGERREGHAGPSQPEGRGLLTGCRVAGFWRDAEWLDGIDGKARPVEPGTFPLAHGITGRVGALRAYGNAIVAPLAAHFIRCYMTHELGLV